MKTVEPYGEESCGNVFADLELPDAEELAIKSALGIQITLAIRRLGLTQAEAGKRMGISQAKVSAMNKGDFKGLSQRKLMDCLIRLGYDIKITVEPAVREAGCLSFAVV
ncbi:MAG: helix-turn-helix domain-containing protein [Candidatus Accumulibacter sp.]|jgi:predicted XRE-type DNA-binding protein|nr:helix-turn-helix domain-containing protein [Accumulibacter sp.]